MANLGGGGVTLCSPFLLRVYPLNHLLFVSFLELQKARTFVSGKLEETVSAFIEKKNSLELS